MAYSLKTTRNTISGLCATLASANSWIITYDNEQIIPPTPEKTWVRVSILPERSQLMAFGGGDGAGNVGKTIRHYGTLLVMVMTPLEGGDAANDEIADKVRAYFSNQVLGGVTFRTPSDTSMGRVDQFWQTNVAVPWHVTEVS